MAPKTKTAGKVLKEPPSTEAEVAAEAFKCNTMCCEHTVVNKSLNTRRSPWYQSLLALIKNACYLSWKLCKPKLTSLCPPKQSFMLYADISKT